MRSRSAAALALGLVTVLAGCGDGGSGLAATPATARIAAVNAAHLCEVQQTTFRTEEEIGAGLRTLLGAEGIEYQDWREWRDSLPDSPERAAQLAEATATGC